MKRSNNKLNNESEVLRVLKSKFRSTGWTQSYFAAQLDISVPTLKRWFRGEGVSVGQLCELMEALDVSWRELAELIPDTSTPKYTYTLAQEKLFVKTSGALALFEKIRHGGSLHQIQKSSDISTISMNKLLVKLEKVGLIDRLSENKIKLKVVGEPRWISKGPLSKHFLESGMEEFLDISKNKNRSLKFSIHNLNQSDKELVAKKIDDLMDFIGLAEARTKLTGPKNRCRNYGMLLAYEHFDWTLLNRIDEV